MDHQTSTGHEGVPDFDCPHSRPGDVPATSQHIAAAEAGELQVLDVLEIADKFKAWRCQDRLAYIQQLESRAPINKLAQPGARLPPNLQPSQLQLKVCSGSNTLSQCLLPTCNPDGVTFLDLPCSAAAQGGSSSTANSIHWQFSLQLLDAQHVGPTGFGSAVQPVRHVARCCIFDRQNNRFLGNVHTLPASAAAPHRGLGALGSHWTWDSAGPQANTQTAPDGTLVDMYHQQLPQLDPLPPGQLVGSSNSPGGVGTAVAAAGEALAAAVGSKLGDERSGGLGAANMVLVRCPELSADPVCGMRKLDGERLSLYVELNVAFKLVAEDADAVPQDEAKGAGLVDELTTCWAMISLKRCAELVRDVIIGVPLYTGSIYEPVLLSSLWVEQRKHHPVRSIFSTPPSPQLIFRAGPLPMRPPPLLPYRLMPGTMLASRDQGYLLATARLALEQQLAATTSTAQHARAASSHTTANSTAQATPAGDSSEAPAQDEKASCNLPAAAFAGFGDPVLAALPKLLDAPVLLRELLVKWSARLHGLQAEAETEAKASTGDCLLSAACANAIICSSLRCGLCRPTQTQLVSALRTSVVELAPLLHCSSLPPAHISNFLEHQAHRAAVAERFCRGGIGPDGAELAMEGCSAVAVKLRGVSLGRHPVDVLTRATGEFVHAPFDVSETRVCMAEWLATGCWSRC